MHIYAHINTYHTYIVLMSMYTRCLAKKLVPAYCCPRRLRLMLRNEQVLAALRAGVTWQLKLWRSTPPVATDYT